MLPQTSMPYCVITKSTKQAKHYLTKNLLHILCFGNPSRNLSAFFMDFFSNSISPVNRIRFGRDSRNTQRMKTKTVNNGNETGLTFRELAQKWGISTSFLGELVADHCKKLWKRFTDLRHLSFCSGNKEAVPRFQVFCCRIQCYCPRYIYCCYDASLYQTTLNEKVQLS